MFLIRFQGTYIVNDRNKIFFYINCFSKLYLFVLGGKKEKKLLDIHVLKKKITKDIYFRPKNIYIFKSLNLLKFILKVLNLFQKK